MKLMDLLRGTGVEAPETFAVDEVNSLEEDSRRVEEGSLFVAIRGFSTDGHLYVRQALESGAVAAIVEHPVCPSERQLLNPLGDNRELLAVLSSRFYHDPWEDLVTVGITGTNGKTSTARMLHWILEKSGMQSGIMGTIGHLVGGSEVPATMTTPGSLETARLMRSMAEAGDRSCIMEVSSHALSLKRVDRVRFDVALFTNITQDHLDYHSNMEEYLECKRHLFDLVKEDGSSLVGTYSPGYPEIPGALTFGLERSDDFRITNIEIELGRISFDLSVGGSSVSAELAVPGRFNVFNAAGAIAAAVQVGVDPASAARALGDFPGVPGRFQSVDLGQDFLVAVDYAHTPDALQRILEQASLLSAGRVIAVFGAGGDRDNAKRPLMGAIASSLADLVVVTSDNPRTEDPDAIIRQIVKGIPAESMHRVTVEPDRRSAIGAAISMARPGDVVIIAGKGHEDYQILGREKIHFDDREEAASFIRKVME